MGMVVYLRAVSDQQMRSLLAEPEHIEEVIWPGGDDDVDSEELLDLDKAWHGIHVLLTGEPWSGDPPLSFLLVGGDQVGDINVGYGPARAFTSSEVREIAEALSFVEPAELRTRFDANRFAELEIYPMIWREPESVCLDGYVLTHFESLKEWIFNTRKLGRGMLVYMA